MSFWRQLRRGIHALRHEAAADREVAEEIAHYLEEATASYEARGLTRDEAVRAARLDLGGATNVREQVRGSGWEHSIDVALADLRYAVRRLRGARAFTTVAVFTLALGIGGTTAIFSVVYRILLAPLPYPHADRVVGDVKQSSLAVTDSDAVYINAQQSWFADNPMSLVVRGRGEAGLLANAVREAIWSIDKDQPIARIATMSELVAASAAERRFALLLFEAFAFTALLLAAAGIYGIMSGSVAERTREIGIRAALGASPADTVGLVVRQGMVLTAVGTVIGSPGAAVPARALAAMLFGVSALDPITYISVVGLLAAVSAIACSLPAWRATRIDPTITLRAQ